MRKPITKDTPATDRQKKILSFIGEYIERRKYAPSIKEIADAHGVTPASAFGCLKSLKEKGFVTWESTQARTIQVLKSWE